MTRELLFRDVEVAGERTDVLVVGRSIAAVGPSLPASATSTVVDGGGGALLPGLHDHHLHLLALAAARASVPVGPPEVRDQRSLAAALGAADRTLPPGAWLRATGYHQSVAGDLDRTDLDRLVARRPVRVQHRSGARWILNSAAIDALRLAELDRTGIERGPDGLPTGRLHRADAWLRDLLPRALPDLAAVGAELAGHGVTGVTDATPYTTLDDLQPLAEAVRSGALPQRVVVTGAPELAGAEAPEGLEWGPVKIVIDDADYPALDALCDQFRTGHRHGRPVAVHCVTRAALVLALAAWDVVGARPGDRVEHGSVIPPDLRPVLRHHGLTVVTQPGFVAERGDQYLAEVDPGDLPHLYPCRSLLDAGIPVAASTDAPYTDPDPWRAIAAASTRTTATGNVLGADEVLEPRAALDLFSGGPHQPGGPPRSVVPGARADLCLLTVPLAPALARPAGTRVMCITNAGRLTMIPA